MPSITVAELKYVIFESEKNMENQKRLNDFLTPFVIVPFEEKATRTYGEIRLEKVDWLKAERVRQVRPQVLPML